MLQCRARCIGCAGVLGGFESCSRFEVVAKIGPLFVADFFDSGLAALLVGAAFIERAQATAMQVSTAGFAAIKPAQGQGQVC